MHLVGHTLENCTLVCCNAASSGNYHYSLCFNPEECSSELLCSGRLESHLMKYCFEVSVNIQVYNVFKLKHCYIILFLHRIKIDYNLYCKFWALQDFFRNPNQCYSKVHWKTFSAVSDITGVLISP